MILNLLKIRKLGVSIETIDDEKKEYLITETLKNREFYSPEERLNIIIQMLLINDTPITIKDIITKTGASKSSILKDLDKCEEWFKKHSIKLIRRKKYGFKIYYDELNWRMCVVYYLRKYLHEINFSNDARKKGYAVPNFNITTYDTFFSIVKAAEEEKAPLIVAITPRFFKYFDINHCLIMSV